MSNHLAIATVTAALGQIALSAAESAVAGTVELLFGRPVEPIDSQHPRKLHVYLYQLTPSAALRNEDLPTRDGSGKLTRRARAALELHYLLSFYGEGKELEPDRMLGAVVRELHTRPIPTTALLRNVIASRTELAGSDLASASESIRFSPAHLSLEELSRLWSIMVQSPHVISVPYIATVVIIDALETAAQALPVLRRGDEDAGVDMRIGPFPQLLSWWSGPPNAASSPRVPSFPAAQLGSRLIVSGANLGGEDVTLHFLHARAFLQRALNIPQDDRGSSDLSLDLADDAAAQNDWLAGIYNVTAEIARGGAKRGSSVLAVPLAPRLRSIQPNPANGAGSDVVLTIKCSPKIHPSQTAVLLVGDREIESDAHAASTDTLTFTIDSAPALANVIARLRVDGVDSSPVVYDPISRKFNFDDAQRVTIT